MLFRNANPCVLHPHHSGLTLALRRDEHAAVLDVVFDRIVDQVPKELL